MRLFVNDCLSHLYKMYKKFFLILLPLFFINIESRQDGPIVAKPIQPQTAVVPAPAQQPAIIPAPEKHKRNESKNGDPEILNIDKRVKVVTSQQNCDLKQWNNDQDDACECCLSYGEGRFGKDETGDQVINHCINEAKQCNASSIANIKKKYNASNMTSDDFLDKLYGTTTVVHKMKFDFKLLGPKGTLTDSLLSSILAQAYAEEKLKDKAFSKKECLNVKTLGAGSGYNTVQLFLVTSTCVTPSKNYLYIVKESKKGLEESTNLKKIEVYPGMESIIAPKVQKGFPTISLPFFYFSYHPHKQNIHYIATMPAADGMVLCELITEFSKKQTPQNAARLKKAYRILGQELSNFHKRFMKPAPGRKLGNTVAHGDLHCHNIFYDEKMGHFTFIDNETMVRSFGNLKKPVIDFVRLFFPHFSTDKTRYEFKELIADIKPGTFLNITLKPFLDGYLSTYSNDEKKQLLKDLKEIFTDKIEAHPLHFNQKSMQALKDEHIIRIFNEIEKTLE
ncbi:MAG TPA: hypothetical protein VJJ26_01675 [Candidatus Babeliales bacterium]|nr:hypothetical protein [Candidatus Babeliales bacterium]